MQIFHVMIVVFMCRVQNDIEVTGADTGFVNLFDFNGIAGQREAFQCLRQYFFTCTQIKQGSNCHVTADSGITFQIQNFFTHNDSFVTYAFKSR